MNRARSFVARIRRSPASGSPRPSGGRLPDPDTVLSAAAGEVARGQVAEAAVRLVELTDALPDHAVAHRELARVADVLASWQGSYVATDDAGVPPRFVPLTELATEQPAVEVLRSPIGVGRRAMERALELEPRSLAWLAPLAELREADGDLDGAIDAYERAVAGTAGSHSAWVVRSRHLWQFRLERALHRRGDGRVDDPLFDAELKVSPVGTGLPDHPPGLFRARFTHQGLNVGGVVADPEVEAVEVRLDGAVLRTVNVRQGEVLRSFDSVLRRPVLDVAPVAWRLEVTTASGVRLGAASESSTHAPGSAGRGQGGAVAVHLPRGSGRLGELLAAGVTVDKKGGLSPTTEETVRRQRDLLRLYDRVRAFLSDAGGPDLFVLYGTLLGLHRQGDLIPGDDDFDCGYVSGATDPAGVKSEAVELITALIRGGFSVSINRRGRLFRVHHASLGDASLHLDVHPVWFEGPDLYVHNHHRFPAAVDDLLPTASRDLRGTRVLIPRRPEALLERFYGPGWRTPEPGYVDDPSGADPEVLARLDEALLTPGEFRELAGRLEADAEDHPGRGELVSIAAQSLYPLDAVVE